MFKFILLFLSNLDKLQDAPGDIPGGPGITKDYGVEQDIKILKGDDKLDDKEPEIEETEEEVEEDETEDEVDETEDEVDETEEDETEEDTEEEEKPEEVDETRITVKGIKKDFPDFFKKHPEMKAVIFREKQFSELFATPQQAQYAARLASQFQGMEADLMSGESTPLIEAMKKANGGQAYEGFISNFLPSLQKTDADTYYKVVAVPLKKALRAAFRHGTERGNKNLAYAAQHLHDFLFENANLDEKTEFEGKIKSAEKTPEQKAYEERLVQLNTRDHINYKTSVDEDWLNGVSEAFLDGLDPDGILSDWTKSKMIEEAVSQLNDQMTKDTRYMAGINNLWWQARNSGYDQSFKTRIVNTSLARAKQIIPTIRQKLRAEALNERRRITKGKDNKQVERKRIVTGRDSNGRKVLSKKDMRGMSDLDIIRS